MVQDTTVENCTDHKSLHALCTCVPHGKQYIPLLVAPHTRAYTRGEQMCKGHVVLKQL